VGFFYLEVLEFKDVTPCVLSFNKLGGRNSCQVEWGRVIFISLLKVNDYLKNILAPSPVDLTVTSYTNGSRIQLKSKDSLLRPVILLELQSIDKKGARSQTKLSLHIYFDKKSALFQVKRLAVRKSD
jgi:hypothetical protein